MTELTASSRGRIPAGHLRKRWVWLLLVTMVVVALVLVWRATSGLSGLDGSEGGRLWGLMPVRPGEAGDFTSFLVNDSGQTVVLRSATLLYEPGYRRPDFVGVMIEPGRSFAGAESDWPPKDLRVRPFAGYRLRSGHTAQILMGIKAQHLGNYAARGVAVTVTAGGQTATVNSIGPGAICVVPRLGVHCSQAFSDRFSNYH